MNNNPIGIFDSGMGGLSIWRELYSCLPGESLLYFGDGKNCPYGTRSVEEIRSLTESALKWMVEERDVKMIVTACNTATIAAIDFLRSRFAIPIIGVEPAVKPAALSTRSGVVAILATESSLRGEMFARTSRAYGSDIRLIPVVGEGFVELVEQDMEATPEALEQVSRILKPLIAEGIDRLVLGCTHYPFLKDVIGKVIGDRDIEIVDSAPAVERRVAQLLDRYNIRADDDRRPRYEFVTLAGEQYRQRIIAKSGYVPDEDF